jgi:hypothetical protein
MERRGSGNLCATNLNRRILRLEIKYTMLRIKIKQYHELAIVDLNIGRLDVNDLINDQFDHR